jgi:hypothetical protein
VAGSVAKTWGVRLFKVLEVIDMLDWCYIAFGEDLGDVYHASVFGGCTSELVWGWEVTGVEEYTRRWSAASACRVGVSLACRVQPGRLSGQKYAGSPLNVLAMCFLRYLARRGMGRNSVPRPIQGAVWVDDFIFVKPAERHPPCAGLEGGCVVCREVLPGSEADHRYMVDLGYRLGLGFSESKRQYNGQKPSLYSLWEGGIISESKPSEQVRPACPRIVDGSPLGFECREGMGQSQCQVSMPRAGRRGRCSE